MSRGTDSESIALIGAMRFANHSCRENFQSFRKLPDESFPCVRLTVFNEILPDKKITALYGSDFFDDNKVNCRCPNHASIKPKRAPSRHHRLELDALLGSWLQSRIFNFVFAHGRYGSDSLSSNEENVRGIPSYFWSANAGLDSVETVFENFVEAENNKGLEPGSFVLVEIPAECNVLESDCTCEAGAASKWCLELKLQKSYRG